MTDIESGTAARRARQEAQRAEAASVVRGVAPPPRASAGTSTVGDGASIPADVPRRDLDPDRLVMLEEERDFLLRSLEDLDREHEVGDVDEADYTALKDDYTARAAAVLRSIENRQLAVDAGRRPLRSGRSLLVGAVVVIFAIVLGVFVAQSSGRRTVGQSVSGDIRQSVRDDLLNAQTLMADSNFPDAIALYDKVLAVSPDNVEALAYKGWLLRLTARQSSDTDERASLTAQSLQLLNTAIKADPAYPDARVFRAVLLRDMNRPQDALADLDALPPGGVPVFMTQMVQKVRSDLEAAVAPGSTVPGTSTVPSSP